MKREIYLKEIIEEFSILKSKIELLSKSNLLDINLISEYHIQEILNIVFDLQLVNSNYQSKNAKAIDLQDEINSIAVQVTSNPRKLKIQETLNKFFNNTLEIKYSTLIILILGKKQLKYTNLLVKEGFNFNADQHIIDFENIISRFLILSTKKIEQVRNILKSDRLPTVANQSAKSVFKSKQLIRKKIVKNLIETTDENISTVNYYDPSYKFIYGDLIIRSISDKSHPNFEDEKTGERADWYKVFSHDLNEHYLEVVSWYNVEIVYTKDGKWNYLNERDKKSISENLMIGNFGVLERIALENIIDVDMDCEDPIIFVQFDNHKACFVEIPFSPGYFNNAQDYRVVTYFELKNLDNKL
jgi:hypothetical protein